jgi:hypothetical protein
MGVKLGLSHTKGRTQFRVCENRVLRRIFGLKEGGSGGRL